ncbi:hypothetical protein RB653_004070 [Dictyostelium firmibasis]|uniref:SAP domain-containing protein n=1 Tax=Dictyostelium firmibasis TaxID=79012 RepID=A0AAN7Z316_9MYCE
MLSKEDVEKMNVKELQKELSTFGLDTKGKKAELQTRLLEHINKNDTNTSSSSSVTSPTTTQKSDTSSNESIKNNTSPTTGTAPTTTAAATPTSTKSQNNGNENMDVGTMTEEERRIHRLNKFAPGGATAAAGAPSTTSSSSSSSSSPKKNKIPTAAALEEEKRKRLLKFGTAPISITSPPPLPEPKVKVPKSKIHVNKKEEIYGSVNEVIDRKKKFGLTSSPTKSTTVNTTSASSNGLSVEERKKKFSK